MTNKKTRTFISKLYLSTFLSKNRRKKLRNRGFPIRIRFRIEFWISYELGPRFEGIFQKEKRKREATRKV